MYFVTLLEYIILLYTCNEVQSQKSTFTCNEVHLRCTFENVTKYSYFVICFYSVFIFGNIVGRCRLHIMAPDRNSAYRNYSLTRVGSFFCEGREACTHCWPLANSHLITLCTQQYEWPLASLFKVSFKLCKLYRP